MKSTDFITIFISYTHLSRSQVTSVVKTYMDKYRIYIDVDQGSIDVSKKQIRRLGSYKNYSNLLCIEQLPSYHLYGCFGTGTRIAGIKPSMIDIQSLKTDRSINSFQDIQHQLPKGTLSCLLKYGDQFCGLTAQHIFEAKSAREDRSILAEIHDEHHKFRLYDVIYVGSKFCGIFEKVHQKAVDAAAFPLN